MPEHPQRQDAASEFAPIQITIVSRRTCMHLISWLPEFTNGKKLVTVDGQEFPSQVGATLAGSARILCVAPAEWLTVSHDRAAGDLREHIKPCMAQQGLALTDLSDGLAALDVRGSAVREVLSKGSGLDFHPSAFPIGRCARTRFAEIPVIIECADEPFRFELTAARSLCQYMHSWLIDAAVEFE